MEERNVNWMLIMSVRYALNRDNGSARSTFEMLVFDAIDYIKDKEYKEYTIKKLIDEIERELTWSSKKDEQSWLVLIEKLSDLEKQIKELENE